MSRSKSSTLGGSGSLSLPQSPVEVLGSIAAGGGACFRIGETLFDCGASPEGGEAAQRHFARMARALLVNPVKVLVISHYHLDHWGCVPALLHAYAEAGILLPKVVCTKITWRLLRRHLVAIGLSPDGPLGNPRSVRHVTYTKHIRLIPVEHSVPGAAAILYNDGIKTILYTGDFWKIRLPRNMPRVDLCIVDSTGALKTGPRGDGEEVVHANIMALVGETLKKDSRSSVFVATFSTQLARICSLSDACKRAHGFFPEKAGRSVIENTRAFRKESGRGTSDRMVICSGVWAQGGEMGSNLGVSKLVQLSHERDDNYWFEPGDRVILSASMPHWHPKLMPAIVAMCNRIHALGVEVVIDSSSPTAMMPFARREKVHCSGHGNMPDIAAFLQQLRPRHVFATHGDNQARQAVEYYCQGNKMRVISMDGPSKLVF